MNCALVETFCGKKYAPERHALSIGDVDAFFLYQSCRKAFVCETKEVVGKGEAGVACVV
jgi:hypothetical protein